MPNMSSNDKEVALGIARDITVSVVSTNAAYVREAQVVSDFYETIYRKITELIINDDA